jgi:hypothetical protein
MQAYFTIKSVEVVKTTNTLSREDVIKLLALDSPIFIPPIPGTNPNPTPTPGIPGDPGIPGIPGPTNPTPPFPTSPTGIDLNSWITLGEKIWAVIVANRPAANVSTQRVAILPTALSDWAQMEGWQGPAVDTYQMIAKNGFGSTVVSQTYVIARNYGGNLGGKGKFLANATVIPTTIDVSWGYTINALVEVGQTVNMGTKENPVPAIDLQLQWKIDSVLKHMEGRDSFIVKGDGTMVHITAGH